MTLATLTRRIVHGMRTGGIRWMTSAFLTRVLPPRLSMSTKVLSAVDDQIGLEIGGPSRVFAAGRMLPVYPRGRRIDNVNFSAQTTWEADLREGGEFRFDRRRASGIQLIRNATALTGVSDNAYDFILSSHCLEHVANPLGALHEWRRVTRTGGHLVLVLPDPARCFDHRRPVTTLAHLQDDLIRETTEDDATHIPEVLALHDLARDPWAGSREAFEERVRRNPENRCIHHHVFDMPLLVAALNTTGWRVIAAERARPVHLCAFAWKP